MLLAGDIGGTKTDLAIFSPEEGPKAPLAKATFPSADYSSLETLAKSFLSRVDLTVTQACFGVAGPVVGDRVEVTNLPWVIDAEKVRQELDLSTVQLLNDLSATANAIPFLEDDELHTLNEGEPDPEGAIAIIAPGTGLGEGFLTRDETRYVPQASEGGHTDFAPTDATQIELLRYLQDRFGHVSYERVCSGKGLPNIYTYLKDSDYAEEPDWLTERLSTTDDPTPVIINAALDEEPPCELCAAALAIFTSILGAEAANLVLKVMATGGVYLGGGIPPHILPALERGQFMKAFLHKGRFSDLMARVPVHVILNPRIALLGAACYGLRM